MGEGVIEVVVTAAVDIVVKLPFALRAIARIGLN
jgi:hypothetical protein